MINQELYEKTVGILVDAYFNDTMVHGNCCACAVGNMVAANMGYAFVEADLLKVAWANGMISFWDDVFVTPSGTKQRIRPYLYNYKAKEQIDATGYTWQELAKIEYAFEIAPKGKSEDEWMFNGLMAVIEVLDQIHENTDTELTASTKQRFKKACAVG